MKALIIGVTGFAGGFLAEHLLESGDQVLGVSRSSTWPSSTPPAVAAGNLLCWDVTRPASEAAARRIRDFQPDVVFHLAGISIPSDCGEIEPTEAAVAANVTGVQHVLDLILQLEKPPRFAFASSCQVYAAPDPSDPRVREDSPLEPDRAYGKTKLRAERLARQAVQQRDLDLIVFRAFNHAGPRQAPRLMLSEWAYQLASNEDGVLRAISLDSHLDLTDVRDTVRAYRALATSAPAGEYNVGSGVSMRSGDVLEKLLHRYHANVKVEELRPGKRQLPIADIQKLQDATGWSPEISLEQTIADTMQYWLEQKR